MCNVGQLLKPLQLPTDHGAPCTDTSVSLNGFKESKILICASSGFDKDKQFLTSSFTLVGQA